jgi:hypothetical protein
MRPGKTKFIENRLLNGRGAVHGHAGHGDSVSAVEFF